MNDMDHSHLQRIRLLLLFGSLCGAGLFLVVGSWIDESFLIKMDHRIIANLEPMYVEGMVGFFSFLTGFASVAFTSFVTAFSSTLLILFGKVKRGVVLAVAVGGGGLANYLIKSLYERARPEINPLIEITGFSFPSGHAMNVILLYGTLAVFSCRMQLSLMVKSLLVSACALLILLIGVSRVFLGVHYPSDILAGFLAGGAWLTAVLFAASFFNKREKVKN
ncbi:phosphatase PAP2 family protein [Bacillus piscicola]|uniref:phosphatase PAP2 family protein n=1 Tax=Bacillus piscicola TaxID=1632684 RepID=UPI0023DD9D4E|nr:phosphatase PAP2 family protein [Bacillus piscicola]